jgi:HCOMODA/2-hydroxy-3-carboxy-muconic semialdehyde decarboxylase
VCNAESELRADVVDACQVLDGLGLTDAFGHVSARVERDAILLSPRVGPGLVSDPAAVLRLAPNGDVLDGDPTLVPGEAPLHYEILAARDDVASVVRFHGAACSAYSTLGRDLPATTGMGLMLGAQVPVHDTALTITTADGARAVASTLGNGAAVLLRGFGAVTVGVSVREAIVRAYFLERAAAGALSVLPIGEPIAYSAEQAAAFAARRAVIAEQVERAWSYLVARWSHVEEVVDA